MTLKDHIEEICRGLEGGQYNSEATVSEGIVLRLLDALDWPRFHTHIIIPEYSLGGRRVDYALCHPPSKPLVFIEVKQVGNIEFAEKQLFEYAFHEGVPIAILTDGREWQFFHPSGQGNYNERKVHELNLVDGDTGENAERFHRYLNYNAVRTGEAVRVIAEDYRKVLQQRQAEARLPDAWAKLIAESDELLVEIVADKVNICVGINLLMNKY